MIPNIDPKQLSTPVRMLIALLDIEWQQAADGFANNPGADEWNRLIRIMHARQAWHRMPLSTTPGSMSKENFASDLMDRGAGLMEWVRSLEVVNHDGLERAETRAKVQARHLPKTGMPDNPIARAVIKDAAKLLAPNSFATAAAAVSKKKFTAKNKR